MKFIVKNSIWTLEFLNPDNDIFQRSDGSWTIGVSDNSLKKVFLANNLPREVEEQVLCHEITHCVCFEYGIFIPIETEEFICNFMANHGKEIIFLLEDLLENILYSVA